MLAATASQARAELLVNEVERRYVLDARTRAALGTQLAAMLRTRAENRTAPAHALTRSQIEARYELTPLEPAGCAVRDVQVTIDMTLTLPEWKPAGRPERGMQAHVARMLQGLTEHEAGHRRNALEAATRIERTLRELPDVPDCERARRAAQRMVSRGLMQMHSRDMHYDLATGFGSAQGALLEVPVTETSRRR